MPHEFYNDLIVFMFIFSIKSGNNEKKASNHAISFDTIKANLTESLLWNKNSNKHNVYLQDKNDILTLKDSLLKRQVIPFH